MSICMTFEKIKLSVQSADSRNGDEAIYYFKQGEGMMSYAIVWVMVSVICLKSNTVTCTTYNHANYKTLDECEDVVAKQNNYWGKIKLNAVIYCIRSSMDLELKK